MSQRDQILTHLKRGSSLTPAGAMSLFGCYRLAARVAELRGAGHNILTHTEERGGKRYARYVLMRGAQ